MNLEQALNNSPVLVGVDPYKRPKELRISRAHFKGLEIQGIESLEGAHRTGDAYLVFGNRLVLLTIQEHGRTKKQLLFTLDQREKINELFYPVDTILKAEVQIPEPKPEEIFTLHQEGIRSIMVHEVLPHGFIFRELTAELFPWGFNLVFGWRDQTQEPYSMFRYHWANGCWFPNTMFPTKIVE